MPTFCSECGPVHPRENAGTADLRCPRCGRTLMQAPAPGQPQPYAQPAPYAAEPYAQAPYQGAPHARLAGRRRARTPPTLTRCARQRTASDGDRPEAKVARSGRCA